MDHLEKDESGGTGDTATGRAGPGTGVTLQPVDVDDPVWHPIDGITLDRYAELTAVLSRRGVMAPDEVRAWLRSEGVEPETWGNVQAGWIERMSTSEAVRTRYGILYSRS